MEEFEKNRLKGTLLESENRYRFVTETSIDAIITSDASDQILTWNKGAKIIFGHGSEIIGKPIETIIPERYRKAHKEGLIRFLETGEKHLIGKKVELEALRRGEDEIDIELSLSSWESQSGTHFGAIIRDISERKHVERIKEDIHRMMRHDLKSPLIGITGLAKVLQKGDHLSDRQRKAATLIQELGTKMLHFIGRSQDLFKIEQGTYELRPKPVNLISLVNRVITELEPLAAKNNIHIRVETNGEEINSASDCMMQGDESLLEIMFENTIKNAIEASSINSTIPIKIEKGINGNQNFYYIDIHNTQAVPKEMRGRFFERYTTWGKKEGTGLGTYSALLITKAHHGNIRFTTSDEEGTHLIIILPANLSLTNR